MILIWSLINLLIITTSVHGEQKYECKLTEPIKTLDKKLKFHDTYKVNAVISDSQHEELIMVTEAAVTDRRVTMLKSRENGIIRWITNISSSKVFCFNQTDYSCSLSTNNSHLLHFPSEFESILGKGSSLSDIASSVDAFTKTNNGSLVDTSIVSGVEGIRWVACINNGSIKVEVVITGDNSFKPASPAFNNPLLLFVKVTKNTSDSDPLSYAVEFNTYDEVTDQDEHLFTAPTGVICDGWDTAELSLNISDPFSSVVKYSDITSNWKTSEIMIWHSPSNNVAYVYEPEVGDTLFLFNERNISKGANVVVHDFATGYEYSLSKFRCIQLSALPGSTSDVISINETLFLRPVNDLFIRGLSFGRYTHISSEDGRNLDVFRAKDANHTVEARINSGRLHSILRFTKNTTGVPQLVSSMFFMPSPQISPEFYSEQIRACFTQASDVINKTYTIDVKSKSIADVYKIGTDVLLSALSSALRQVASVNPFRFRIVFESKSSGNLGVFITVAEKSNVVPANVGYNFSEEVSTADFFLKFNDTISKGDWKFSVPTPDRVEEWTVLANSLSSYPETLPPSSHSYVGYSGGSMFVLGLFSIILGAAIGAGGVFFISKRQRISTLAYQVFE